VAAGASRPADSVRLLDTSRLITSFGQDAQGELYLCDRGADAVYKIVPN
jgi:hypothetical protein